MIGSRVCPDSVKDLPCGPELAAAVTSVDPAGLVGHDLVGLAQAVHRLLAHYQAVELAVLAELATAVVDPDDPDDPDDPGQPARGPGVQEYAVEEAAAGLSLTLVTAERQLGLAMQAVHRLPAVHAAMLAGRVDAAKARTIVAAVEFLDEPTARAVVDRVLPETATRTTSQLWAKLRRLVLRADPSLAQKRYRDGVNRRALDHWQDTDGTWVLSGRGLPPDLTAAALDRIDTVATALRKAGDPRELHQIRVDVYLGLLNDQPDPGTYPADTDPDLTATTPSSAPQPTRGGDQPAAALVDDPAPADTDPDPSGAVPGSGAGEDPDVASPASTPGGDPAPAGRGGGGRLVLAVPLLTLLGMGSDPGELTGWGTVVAEVARRIVAFAPFATPIGVSATDPDGRVIWHGSIHHRHRPADTTTSTPARSGAGRLELTVPLATLLELAQNPEKIGNWGPVVVEAARRAVAYLATTPTPVTDTNGWVTGTGGTPRHPSTTDANWVRARDRCCRFPGCRRPARRCELDHTIEWQHGGPTVPANLGALCKRHHIMKTLGAWQLTQPTRACSGGSPDSDTTTASGPRSPRNPTSTSTYPKPTSQTPTRDSSHPHPLMHQARRPPTPCGPGHCGRSPRRRGRRGPRPRYTARPGPVLRSWCSPTALPTTRRECRSSTAAQYSGPSSLGISVRSPTHTWLGSGGGVKSRRSRSGACGSVLAGQAPAPAPGPGH